MGKGQLAKRGSSSFRPAVVRLLQFLGLRERAAHTRDRLVSAAKQVGLIDPVLEEARRYVSTTPKQGKIQLQLLLDQGCTRSSCVLEVGCGCLNAGVPIMKYLDRRRYVAIEPNKWLVKAALRKRSIRRLVAAKAPLFLHRTDFDSSQAGVRFDFVFSHSVLSHCAHDQLAQFLGNSQKVLNPGGCILASIRLAGGNSYGSSGSPDGEDSRCASWQYPGVSYFKLSTVQQIARANQLAVTVMPEYTSRLVELSRSQVHDWLVFKHTDQLPTDQQSEGMRQLDGRS